MASKIIENGKIFPQSIANLNGIYPRYMLCILYEDAKQSSRYYVTILVGISATMCHSAEKIPAKEECQYKRVRT